MTERWVALLGRKDRPTDGVEDYCCYLASALKEHGISLETRRVNWDEEGWRAGLREIHKIAQEQTDSWFLFQYTALGWSRRGFPLRVPRLIRLLKRHGARCAVVFHDPNPFSGSRVIDRLRRMLQIRAMRRAIRLADVSVLTIPPERISWIPRATGNAVFIPVGANLPSAEQAWRVQKDCTDSRATIGVFAISADVVGKGEVKLIAEAVRYTTEKTGKLRLVVLGKNSSEAGRLLQQELSGAQVQIIVHGILEAEEVPRVLGSCHAMLFTRGPISSRRGSAIAGIACGLPVIALEGSETASPVTEAGVVLLRTPTGDEFGRALVRVITDNAYRESLAERSRRAQERYFSWNSIADLYVRSFRKGEIQQPQSDSLRARM